MEKEDVLKMAKDLLKDEMSSIGFNTWIKDLGIHDVTDTTIVLIAKSIFQKNTIDGQYRDLILNTFKYLTNRNYDVTIILEDEQLAEKQEIELALSSANSPKLPNSTLNPNYTFDTFVVGGNNNLAHAVAINISETPGKMYNPLFIYGGVGLRENTFNASNW